MSWILSSDGTTIDDGPVARPYAITDIFGATVHLSEGINIADLNSHGWYEVGDVVRPPNTPTETFAVTVVNTTPGVFDQQWNHNAAAHVQRLADEDVDTRYGSLQNDVSVLRGWASDAAATTWVGHPNQDAVMQTMIDRLGVFFDHFADLLEILDRRL